MKNLTEQELRAIEITMNQARRQSARKLETLKEGTDIFNNEKEEHEFLLNICDKLNN
jgi:hypothetical protein